MWQLRGAGRNRKRARPSSRWRPAAHCAGVQPIPAVAGPLATGGSGKQEAAEQAGLGGEQVAQLTTHSADGAEGMFAGHQLLPEAELGCGSDRLHGKAGESVNAWRQGRDWRQRDRGGRRGLAPGPRLGGRQADQASLIEALEGGQATAAAESLASIAEIERLADWDGGGPAAGGRVGDQQAAETFEVVGLQQGGANRHRCVHASIVRLRTGICQGDLSTVLSIRPHQHEKRRRKDASGDS